MNKKFIFLIILTLFIGLLLGYTGEYLANSTSMASIPTDKEKSPTSHRFGDSRDGPKIDVSRKETSRKIKNTQLNKQDEKLLRLTQMSQAEMQREMAKICQKAISPSHLNAQDQLAFAFLCSRLGQKAPLQILEQMDGGAKYNARFKNISLMSGPIVTRKRRRHTAWTTRIRRTLSATPVLLLKALPILRSNGSMDLP